MYPNKYKTPDADAQAFFPNAALSSLRDTRRAWELGDDYDRQQAYAAIAAWQNWLNDELYWDSRYLSFQQAEQEEDFDNAAREMDDAAYGRDL